MEMRPIADTGLRVSVIGLGTVKFGRNQGVKYPHGFDLPDEKSLADLLALAREEGINLLDTAPAYGSSEERLGRLLSGRRQDWVISTKAGEIFENGRSRFDFTPAGLTASVEESLKRLCTDYVDILLVHSDGRDMEIIERDGVIDTLTEIKRRGLARAIGFSGKTVAGALRALEEMDVVMATLNPVWRGEWPVLEAAAAQGKAILVKKAFESGHAAVQGGVEEALRLSLTAPGVASVVCGTINPAHLSQNAALARKICSGV